MADPDLSAQSVPATEEEIADGMLAYAQSADLPVTSWGQGQPWLVLMYACAQAIGDVALAVARMAKNAYVGPDGAAGVWLQRALASHYADKLVDPDITVGHVLFEDNGGGPHTITTEVLVGTSENTGLVFRVLSLPLGGDLVLNGSLPAVVRAIGVGGKYNVANGAIKRVITALPTVTVSNPSVGVSGTWITNLGADQESDAAAQKRAPKKWATLATGSPRDAYLYWALSTPGVTRASVDDNNPLGPNSIKVYVDNPGSVAALQSTLDEKAPDGTKSLAAAAAFVAVTIPGVVEVKRSQRAVAEATASANLVALQNEIDIGGKVIAAEVSERIMSAPGVVDFTFASSWTGAPNIQLAPGTQSQFTVALAWVEV